MVTPYNISGRNKQEIVEQAEVTWLIPYLVNKAHEVDCRCNSCINAKLDALLTVSEAAAQVNY